METNIHYPAESSLIRDGLRKILEMCSELAVGDSILGWRQHHHLWKRVKQLAREIDRIAGKKGPELCGTDEGTVPRTPAKSRDDYAASS